MPRKGCFFYLRKNARNRYIKIEIVLVGENRQPPLQGLKGVKGVGSPPNPVRSLKGRHFFLTVPHFHGTPQWVLGALEAHQPLWQYCRYAVVLQLHRGQGAPGQAGTHLHLYLGFPKQLYVRLDRFDYLGKHGKLQRVRNYASVLRYMSKQGRPVANFDYLEDVMRKDFPCAMEILMGQGLDIRQIYRRYSRTVAKKNWSGYLRFLKYQQDGQKFLVEYRKPGFLQITPQLVRQRLSDQQYRAYCMHPQYGRIVALLNDVVQYGSTRPHKAKALFLTGAPNTGKTTLGLALQKYVGTFTFPDDGWWQGYQSGIFKVIVWNQFDLRRFQYPTLLKFLEGLRLDLPIKGSHVTRSDNPLILLTSNLSLEQLICRRFSGQENRAKARANLGARIEEVAIGQLPLFLLLKLLVCPP